MLVDRSLEARPTNTDMSGLTPFSAVPLDALRAERLLMQSALTRTQEAGDTRAEGAARRCLTALEDEILQRVEC